MTKPLILGKDSKPHGKAPAVVLCDPRYPHNVGAAVRAASCYGLQQVWFTGERVALEIQAAKRVPREERMKGFKDVEMINYDRPLEQFPKGCTPVAVEVRPGAEFLPYFEHPENPVYVFGPEDGSIPQAVLAACHRFVIIPTRHCLNLAAAVYTVLYDRHVKSGGIWTPTETQQAVEDPKVEFADVLFAGGER